MKITELTNVLKSGEIRINKSIGTLAIKMSTGVSELLNEKITIYIERANGNNVYMQNKTLLKDYIYSSTYGGSSIQSDVNSNFISMCELSLQGSIFLDDKETLIIELDGLRANIKYELFGLEEPEQTNLLYFTETKTLASDDVNKRFAVSEFDMMVLSLDASVSDVSLTYPNGQVIKYLPEELRFMQRDIDNISAILEDGTVVQNEESKVVLPLVGIQFIEINKSQGSVINMTLRTLKSI